MKEIKFETSEKIRLDEYLRRELPVKVDAECSNSKIRRLIVAGSVSVNGRQVMRPGFELRGHSSVYVNFDSEKFFFEKQPDDIKYEVAQNDVLYEDENLIFINKPSFFPVEQTITGNRDNLHDAVVRYLWNKNPELRNPPYVGIMHRLDRETSGVILFTKNRGANKPVHEMFENHKFSKEYVAVVTRRPVKNHFVVEKFMGRVSGKSQAGKWGSVPESKGGQYSRTEFFVEGQCKIEGNDCWKIRCVLFTGRTHQIRFHLSDSGLPILGDELYGGKNGKRIYLHSSLLGFDNELGKLTVQAKEPWIEE